MTYLWIGLSCLVATVIFDFVYTKMEYERAAEYHWQLLNEQREREGKPRLDEMDRDDEDIKKKR